MKKKLFTPLHFLVLSFILMLFSCTTVDLGNLNHDSKAGINSRKITFSELQKHTKVFNLVNEFNQTPYGSTSKLNKNIKNTTEPLTVDTHEGLYLEYANLHSFTFPIHREIDNGKLENLVFSYQNDGSYKIKILKYNLTPQEKIDLEHNQLKTIQNPVITIPINSGTTHFKIKSCDVENQTIWVACSEGVHNSSNINDWAKCEAATPPRVYTVSRFNCLEAGESTSTGGAGNFPVNGGDTYGSAGGAGGVNDYSVNYPTPQTNPEEYEQGISTPINPSLVGGSSFSSSILIAQAIEDNIDYTTLDDCTKKIMEKLKNSTNDDLSSLFKKFDPSVSLFNITIKAGTVKKSTNTAETSVISPYNYNITLNSNYLNGSRDYATASPPTTLSIATTITHEIIHAYLLSLVDEYNLASSSVLCDFPELFNTYVTNNIKGGSQEQIDVQHEVIAQNYLYAIASTIERFHKGISGNPSYPPQVYIDMAWSGLIGTDIFNKNYPNDPNHKNYTDRERIKNRRYAEDFNISRENQSPIGEPCK